MFYLKAIFFIINFLLLILCQCNIESKKGEKTTWIGSGLEFEDYYAMKSIDSILNSLIKVGNEPKITMYFFVSFKNTKIADFTFYDTFTTCEIFEVEGNSIAYKENGKILLIDKEKKEIDDLIETKKPFSLLSITDLFVDDGYTVIVKNLCRRFNLFSVRAMTKESQKSQQYLFIKQIINLLKKHKIEIEI